jgi:hypothetical protein
MKVTRKCDHQRILSALAAAISVDAMACSRSESNLSAPMLALLESLRAMKENAVAFDRVADDHKVKGRLGPKLIGACKRSARQSWHGRRRNDE